METLILIRHGETRKNVDKKLHSQNDTEELNSTGIIQIKEAAEQIMKFKPSKIYTSLENRAIQSGQLISQQLNIPIESIDGLQERNWGEFIGKPWTEVQRVLDQMSLEERFNYTPPTGESWKEFEARLIKTLNKILEQNGGLNTVIVTHGGVIRALIPHLLNTPRQESFKYDPENGSLTVFEHNHNQFRPVLIQPPASNF